MPAPRVLVVEHQATCPPARFGAWLVEATCVLEMCRPYLGDPLPPLDGYHGLVVLGGSMDSTDPTVPWLQPVQELIREADRRGLVTLGICLGHQLCALAFGGQVERSRHGQQVGVVDVGWESPWPLGTGRDLGLHDAPEHPRRPAVFWNDDVVTVVPDGAEVLARAPGGDPQAIRFRDRVWGVQWHPEADLDVVRPWAVSEAARHIVGGVDQERRLAAIVAATPTLLQLERRLARRFAERARLQAWYG
ncbi:type 1 glutamine amidotransferase [soil metagenome]